MTQAAASNLPGEAFKTAVAKIVGEKGLIDEPGDLAPYLEDRRGRVQGRTPFVVRPADTEEVAAVVRACVEARVPIVPQGGNTGLTGGSVPFESGEEVVLNLGRMNRVRELDASNFTITAEAGCILQQVQQAAEAADRLFPLSLGAEGSCQIGGNLSTNAGGVQVLRFGNMRDLVLGLEVVLPDGRIWNGLRRLRKDNTGYDLKHLFIGAEGTLGIITAAVLKLFPRPREVVTAFAAVPSPAAALALLEITRAETGDSVTSFELMPRRAIDFALKHVSGVNDPLAERSPWYVLIELFGGRAEGGLRSALEAALGDAFERELVSDATFAESATQGAALWRIREAIVEAQKYEGGSIKHDVSVPVSRTPDFIAEATALVERLVPGIRPVPFGHLGDGNIHFNLSQPEGADKAAYLARWDEVKAAVHDVVHAMGGSISAEHGIGRFKLMEIRRFKDPVELDLMRQIKQSLDPHNLFNPGKVI